MNDLKIDVLLILFLILCLIKAYQGIVKNKVVLYLRFIASQTFTGKSAKTIGYISVLFAIGILLLLVLKHL